MTMAGKKSGNQQAPRSDLTLKNELPYYPKLPKDGNVFEGCPQHLVLARTEEEDILFWASSYFLHGSEPGGFLADDASTLGIILLTVPHEDRGKMNDTDFIAYGYSPLDYLKSSDMKITETSDQVVWSIKETDFVCRPPHWEVKGKQSGIEYDLRMVGNAPTTFYLGDYDKVLEEGLANFDQFTRVDGTIKAGGKTYEIIQGRGTHEHPIVARHMGSMVDRFRHSTHYWMIGGGEGIQCWIYGDFPGRDTGRAKILLGDRVLTYDENITVDVLDYWSDPRSLATIPCKWHINMYSEEGILDLNVAASARVNRMWCLRDGYVLDVWLLSSMNGVFLHPDGKTIPIRDVPIVLEWLRTIWP